MPFAPLLERKNDAGEQSSHNQRPDETYQPGAKSSLPIFLRTPRAEGPEEARSKPPGDRTVIDREVAEVTTDPSIQAKRPANGPVVLTPTKPAPSPAEQAKGALPPAPKTAPKPTAAPGPKASPQAAAKEGREKAIQEVAPKRKAGAEAAKKAAAPGGKAAKVGEKASAGEPARGPSAAPGSGPEEGGALAAMVPEADPNSLRAQLPQRAPSLEEFQAATEERHSPEENRAQALAMLDGLRADAAQEKDSLAVEATARKAAIAAEADAQTESIRASAGGIRAAIRARFAAARVAVARQAQQKKALIPAQVAQDVARADAASTEGTAAAQTQGDARKAAITAYAQNQQQQPPVIAGEESARASSELESAAQECERAGDAEAAKYPGNDDPKPDQRQAALQVAAESASDIRAKKPEIAEDMRSRAAEFGGKYMEYADAVNQQIDQALAQLIPALQQAATDAAASIRQTQATALQGIDDRAHADTEALQAGESSLLAQLQSAEQTAVQQIQSQAQKMSESIDEAAAAIGVTIDRSVDEAAAVVEGEELPNLPGMSDIVESGRLKVRASGETGRGRLGELENTARENLTATATTFDANAGRISDSAQSSAADVVSRNAASIEQCAQARETQANEMTANLRGRQQAMTQGVMAEVDAAAEKARTEMRGINDQFRTQCRQAADEAIAHAVKPRTDKVETRAAEAAEQAGESWWKGLLRAIGQIVIGLVILIVVAVIVAAIAAAFGVLLTAWTAIRIAGAILLAVGLVISIIHRAGQQELGGNPAAIVGLALLDTVGITGIIEGVSGNDIVTGQKLSDADRTERGVLGAVTLVTLVLGVRSAVKGPPGGAFVRPGSLGWSGFGPFFKGFVGFGDLLPAMWKGAKPVGIEIYLGLRTQIKDVGDWLSKKFQPATPTAPGGGPPQVTPGKQLSASGWEGSISSLPGGGVFETTIPGVKEPVAVKVYPDDGFSASGQPNWYRAKFMADMAGAEAAAQTPQGPKFYGQVDVGPGRLGFAMEKVPGGMIDAATADPAAVAEAAKAASSVNQQTLTDFDAYSQALLDRGFYARGEVQGLVDSNGRWRPIDFQSIETLPTDPGPRANAIADHTRNMAMERKGLAAQAAQNGIFPTPPPVPRPVDPHPDQHQDTPPVQPKLRIGSANDPLEREADEIAEAVAGGGSPARGTPSNREAPLIPEVRLPVERLTGSDLGQVRVRHDPDAQAAAERIGARAFTQEDEICVAAGESPDDVRLMAHEAAHVVQQRNEPKRSP
jgi:hypothetical protein